MLDQPVLTLQQVARYLSVHPNTIYRLVRRGRIPAFKIGSDWRFNRESIDAWRLAQEQLGGSQSSNESAENLELRTELLDIIEWYLEEALQKSVSLSDLGLFSESSESAVRLELRRMIAEGLLEMAGAGKQNQYRLTPVGRSYVRSTRAKAEQNQAGHASFVRTAFGAPELKPATSNAGTEVRNSVEMPGEDGATWTR